MNRMLYFVSALDFLSRAACSVLPVRLPRWALDRRSRDRIYKLSAALEQKHNARTSSGVKVFCALLSAADLSI